MKIGRQLAIKLLNASKFALGLESTDRRRGHRAARPVDAGRRWPTWSTEATAAFDRYDYARALERTEGFFWSFCDDYLELVKNRAYGAEGDGGARRRPAPPCGLALRTPARAVRPVPAVRHRGGVVVVAGGLGPPVAVAVGRRPAGGGRGRRRVAGRRARPGGPGRGRPPCSARSARPRARPSGRCAPRSVGRRHRHARAAGAAGAGRGRRPQRPAASATLRPRRATRSAVTVELAPPELAGSQRSWVSRPRGRGDRRAGAGSSVVALRPRATSPVAADPHRPRRADLDVARRRTPWPGGGAARG